MMAYAKAFMGGVVAGLTALQGAFDNGVTGKEWITVCLATLAGLGFVYVIPNRAS